MLRTALLVTLMLVSAVMVSAQQLPKPVGFVNDFANMLAPHERQELETLLQEYKNKTEVEFAVVTERSLDGENEFDRSLRFAREWAPGSKELDYGLLLYVALEDRAYFLQVSTHLEGDLPDGLVGQIQREKLVPHFRNKEYFKGILETVKAVIDRLGATTIAERERTRQEKEAAQKRQQEQWDREAAERLRKFKVFLTYAVPIALVIGIPLIVFLVARSRKRKLEALRAKVVTTLNDAHKNLRASRSNEPQASIRFEDLKSKAPYHDWSALEQRIEQQSEVRTRLARTLTELRNESTAEHDDAVTVLEKAEELLEESAGMANLLSDIEGQIKQVETAESKSIAFLESMPLRIALLKEKLALPNVPEDAKTKVNTASSQYNQAKRRAGKEQADWLGIHGSLESAQKLLDEAAGAIEYSQRPKPTYTSSTRRSSGSTTWGSTDSSKSDTGGGSTFGGFGGGGNFGGGGAGGRW